MVNQADIHGKSKSSKVEERREAVTQFCSNFMVLSDKEQAWNDLIRLTGDEDSAVRWRALEALGTVFSLLPDKEQALDDLIQLLGAEDIDVQLGAALLLGTVFSLLPDKELTWVGKAKQAWEALIPLSEVYRKIIDGKIMERREAVTQLCGNFMVLSDKEQAWNDLIRLAGDEDGAVRWGALMLLGVAFPLVLNKEQAWNDLIRLAGDEDSAVRWGALMLLGAAFPLVPNKEQAWNDLIRLTGAEDIDVQLEAAVSLGVAFPLVPNKEQAWNDLIRLTGHQDSDVQWGAAFSLEVAFPFAPNKEQAWNDLIRLTGHQDFDVRMGAVVSLGEAFSLVPDKEQAWNDLIRLTGHQDSDVRFKAAVSLGAAFPFVPDKEKAWNDLIRLTGHQDSDVRFKAAVSLGAAFPFVPDKEKAWNDLIRLTGVKDIDVQWGVAVSLGAAFPFASDKKQAWNDLIRPTENENYKLWGPANYALGRVSIIKATEAESKENIRKEIETALAFFEKASEGMSYHIPNPAKFCKLFYRSWYMITFKQTREAEVQKYLAEAKYIAEGSESKERLLEAVENLANALREAQKARQKGLDAMKSDLNAIRKYCERAAEILATTEEKAPGATKLIKRGLPIIGETIKEIIGEIKDKAEVVCRQTKGTPLEYLGFELYRQGHNLSLKIRDPIGLEKGVDNLLLVLSDICASMFDEVRGGACKLLDMAKKEPYVEDKLHLINIILSKIPPQMSISRLGQKLDDLMIRLKPGIRAELTTSGGLVVWGSGMQLKITIPLQEIPYPEFKEDLEEIKRKGVIKLASLPPKLAKIVKDYLILDLLKR